MDALVINIPGGGKGKYLLTFYTPGLERKDINHFCIFAIGWNPVMWPQQKAEDLGKCGLAEEENVL